LEPGQILVSNQYDTQVIKLVGDVRLTLCVSFDKFIESMFNGKSPCSVVFDLTQAEAIDSTTLGLMAKIAILTCERCDVVPVVFSTNYSINRLLDTMGFDDIFEIVQEERQFSQPCRHLSVGDLNEDCAKERVLEAHQILMQMNAANRETFRDLVNTLEGR